MAERPNLLVVCGRNKRRSRTAEYIFKNDKRFNIRSVGLSPKSERQIKEKDINWADSILVMEQDQSSRIRKSYRQMNLPPIDSLRIADDFEYLDPALVELLTEKINSFLEINYKI